MRLQLFEIEVAEMNSSSIDRWRCGARCTESLRAPCGAPRGLLAGPSRAPRGLLAGPPRAPRGPPAGSLQGQRPGDARRAAGRCRGSGGATQGRRRGDAGTAAGRSRDSGGDELWLERSSKVRCEVWGAMRGAGCGLGKSQQVWRTWRFIIRVTRHFAGL